jgi:non-ribosomal peptide synthetase component E (peptide arylation enzyme)
MRAASCGCWAAARMSSGLGSETAHASQVGQRLQRHPEVLAAAVVVLPHARLGEQVLMRSLPCRMVPHNILLIVVWRYS